MKRLILSLTLLSAACFTIPAVADPPDEGTPRKRPSAAERRGGPPGGPPQRDPAKMVERIMSEFDKDGDQKLDKTELIAWATAMNERRAQFLGRRGEAGQGRLGQGKPGKGRPGGQGNGKKRRGIDPEGTPGGDQPVLPDAE